VRYFYEGDSDPGAPPRSRGNLIKILRLPGPKGGDQDSLVEHFEYATDMGGCCGTNFVTKYVNPRGDSTLHTYDAWGNRIHTQYFIPSISEDWEYNAYGQMTRHIHPDNGSGSRREDVYSYYTSGPSGGYLREEIIDASNFALTTTYEYDLVGNPVRIIDPRGHDSRYTYNQIGQVVRETFPEVRDGTGIRYTTETFYDANDNVVRVDISNIDEDGNIRANAWITTTYDYEILNQMIRRTQEVDPLNDVVTEYEYDANRNRTLIRYGEATGGDQDPGTVGAQPTNTLTVEYDERDLLFLETRAEDDPLQSTAQYNYDGNGNVERTLQGLESDPREYLSPYDGYGRLTSNSDPMGNITIYTYDPNGDMVYTRTDGELVDVVGGALNMRLSEVAYTYDAMGREVLEEVEFFDTETQAPILDGKVTTQIEYSDNSQVIRVTDDNGHSTEAIYDTANRVLTTTDAKGNTRTYRYDENCNVVVTREVEKSDLGSPDEQFITTYTYDNLNRLIRTVDNANQVMEHEYDSGSSQTKRTDALGNIIRYEYDGLNRLLVKERILTDNGLGAGSPVDTVVTERIWDATSRLTGLTDDNGNTTIYRYDPLNRRTVTEYADGTTDSVVYEVHDNVANRIDANGNFVASAYDSLDRLTRRTVVRAPGVLGDTSETYQYDGLSRVVSAEDDDSKVERKYDSLSRVISETITGVTSGTASCSYDGVGNLCSCFYPKGREITRAYDELDRVQAISDQDGLIATYSYVGLGRVERREYPKPNPRNTVRTDYSYDWAMRITGTTHVRDPEGDAEVVDARTYAWDAMSNKVERSDIRTGGPRLKHLYTYDSIYRLVHTKVTDAIGATVRDTDYDLDGVGNRTLVTGDNCPGSYTMDPTLPEPADFQVNQYTATPCDGRLYDRNGNLVRIDDTLPEQRDIVYDYRNQMITYTGHETGEISTYGYDPLGRRIVRVVDDGTPETTCYSYVGWQVVEEADEVGTTQATYVYGLYIDEVLNMKRGDVDYYYHTDDIYNVMAITDANGNVVERYKYQDYGEPEFFDGSGTPIPSTTIDNPYLFTGRRRDTETGWYYYRTRHLDPVTGRFTTRDPVGTWEDDFGLGNGYTYVGNKPTVAVDPWGLSTYEIDAPFKEIPEHFKYGAYAGSYIYGIAYSPGRPKKGERTEDCNYIKVSKKVCKSCYQIWCWAKYVGLKFSIYGKEIDLPKWKRYDKATPDQKAEWDRFIKALETHEKGHLKVADETVAKIKAKSEIEGKSEKECWDPKKDKEQRKKLIDEARKDRDSKYTEELERIKKILADAQTKYETETDHGTTQGATLDTSKE
jgi:RHS repeat-associated protein